jgi:hypothetical protein
MKFSCQANFRCPVEMFRRSRRLRAFLAILIAAHALATSLTQAAPAAPTVQPPSKWVMPRPIDRPLPGDVVAPSQDYRWLLYDRQINAQVDEEFVHEVCQPLTAAGVQYGSRIFINYDPACQSLTFHWARIWRGTNKLDRLDLSTMRVNDPAPSAKEWLFGSDKTAMLLLEGVRAGDIVDYAYTIEGRNPALGAKLCDSVQLQFPQPVDRAVTRLVWPYGRRLFLTNHLTNIQPTPIRKTNVIEFVWDVRKVPGLRMEPQTPASYDPYPWVQISDFQNWADVNRWALRLFTTNKPPSPELARKINEWKLLPDPADRVTAALRFVQEESRSPGPEDDSTGFEPGQPSVVFERRFGDAKDKSFLLVTMLRALKIESFPVLVNNQRGAELPALLPSPIDFNRIVVQVNVGGGSFWLDPTAAYERGRLTSRYWADYGWGLVVGRPPSAWGLTPPGLTPIPPCPVQPMTTVSEYLNVGGTNSESTAKIVTVSEGPDADRLRRLLATTPREDIDRENLKAFAMYYPFTRSTGPTVYSDDEHQNRIETTEYYTIAKLWRWVPEESIYRFQIFAFNLAEAMAKPAASFRSMPLAARHPVHEVFHAEVKMSALPVDSVNVTVDSPVFYFRRTATAVGNTLILKYEYRSRTDAVAPLGVPTYARDMNTAMDSLGYSVVGGW